MCRLAKSITKSISQVNMGGYADFIKAYWSRNTLNRTGVLKQEYDDRGKGLCLMSCIRGYGVGHD